MQPSELVVADAAAWQAWLGANHGKSAGVWLVLAKKGTTQPTSLGYDDALEAALAHGWVDGQLRKRDDATFARRFGPRRAGSAWSKRNVAIAERLLAEGRMQPAGLAAVEAARADGRWARAYAGQADSEVPADLAAALQASPEAAALWPQLSAANRYAVLYRVQTAARPETRARRIEQLVAMLARGETLHPQR